MPDLLLLAKSFPLKNLKVTKESAKQRYQIKKKKKRRKRFLSF
uniref:Testis cDNA clone: QtsA-12318, similar to human projection protein PF6 (PF6) n=1 Tax=Macaca fascicularis TaxID=9541 RepID=Q4R8J9_MACFA|nr:unnamed protein product [Macaca fascicularis]